MAPSREPNPLRPYYVPPSIGPAPGAAASSSQPASAASSRPARPTSTFQSSASDLLPELDLDFKTSAGEAWTNTRILLDSLAWRYASCLMAQPFDVAKTVLQVSLPPSGLASATSTPRKRRTSPRSGGRYGDEQSSRRRGAGAYDSYSETDEDVPSNSEDDDEMPNYFTSSAPARSRSPRKRRRSPPSRSPSPDPTPTPSRNAHNRQDPLTSTLLPLKRPDSVSHALSALYNSSGAVGLWRATNCTFLYTILLRTTDSFLRSLLLALFGLPDLTGPDASGLGLMPAFSSSGAGTSGLDLSDSPSPIMSIAVIGLASCLSGILLAPLDVIRTRLILTTTSHHPRGVLSNLKRLPSLLCSSSLWLPTALYHTLPTLFSTSAPQLLRRQFRLTPETAPSIWTLSSFTTSLSELFLRLPLELSLIHI